MFKYIVTTEHLNDVKVEDLYLSKACWDRAAAYLDVNDFIPSWVAEHYRKIQTEDIKTFVGIKDLYAHFKQSDHFQTLSKREQRNQNEGKFRKAIEKSNAYKALYREAQKVRLEGGYNSKDGLINVEPVEEVDDVDVVSEGSASSSTQPAKRARK